MFRSLSEEKIIQTVEKLRHRVQERFPESGLSKVANELEAIAGETRERCRFIRQNHTPLRVLTILFIVLGGISFVLLLTRVKITEGMWLIQNFLEELNAALGSCVFIGAAIVFLISLERRFKRRKALVALNELRALAHVVDMHQLTKDPEPILGRGPTTPHSPVRNMTPFELSRYFDYSSEMLSLISKIAALYVQSFPDPIALAAVDEVEALCTGLSRKIWQKIMIVDQFVTPSPPASPAASPEGERIGSPAPSTEP